MAFRFSTRIPMRWQDIDSFGVLNNAVYFTLLEQARYEYFAHLDLLRDDNFPFVLGETRCRYQAPGRLGMLLDVGVRIDRLGTKSLESSYEVSHDNDVLATANATLVWVDEGMHSLEIPPEAREAIAGFEGLDEA